MPARPHCLRFLSGCRNPICLKPLSGSRDAAVAKEGLGFAQDIHLVADGLHLIAAGLWLGALAPLVLLPVYLWRCQEDGWVLGAACAKARFSTPGILAVSILLVSGTINAAFLLGGMHSLIDTEYGRLLLLKVALAAAMVGWPGSICLSAAASVRLPGDRLRQSPKTREQRAGRDRVGRCDHLHRRRARRHAARERHGGPHALMGADCAALQRPR